MIDGPISRGFRWSRPYQEPTRWTDLVSNSYLRSEWSRARHIGCAREVSTLIGVRSDAFQVVRAFVTRGSNQGGERYTVGIKHTVRMSMPLIKRHGCDHDRSERTEIAWIDRVQLASKTSSVANMSAVMEPPAGSCIECDKSRFFRYGQNCSTITEDSTNTSRSNTNSDENETERLIEISAQREGLFPRNTMLADPNRWPGSTLRFIAATIQPRAGFKSPFSNPCSR